MKDFAMQLTQKCVSMGLLDESYSEWFAYSIEKRVTTLFTWLVQCLIGGFCFGWTLTISFSVFFLLIRKYTNGYHAATYSITPKSAWRTMQNRCTSAQTGSSETSQAVYENKPCAVHPVASDGQCAELVGEYRL